MSLSKYDNWKLQEPPYLKRQPEVSHIVCEDCGKSNWQYMDSKEVDGFEVCEFQCLSEFRDAEGEWVCGHTMRMRA